MYLCKQLYTPLTPYFHSHIGDGNHTVLTHLAKASSVHDLHEQVAKRLPEGTPIPSQQWLRLQFWPRTSTAATSRFICAFYIV